MGKNMFRIDLKDTTLCINIDQVERYTVSDIVNDSFTVRFYYASGVCDIINVKYVETEKYGPSVKRQVLEDLAKDFKTLSSTMLIQECIQLDSRY